MHKKTRQKFVGCMQEKLNFSGTIAFDRRIAKSSGSDYGLSHLRGALLVLNRAFI